jgi:hypothetical protein
MVSCKTSAAHEKMITIHLQHHEKHTPYYDVSMPLEALEMIRDNLQHCTPVAMVGKVQALYANVTAKQIHAAWTEMSEVL